MHSRSQSSCLQHRADHASDPRAQGIRDTRAGGAAYVYVPLIGREAARRRALSLLLNGFFDGSPELLVLNLLGRDEPDEDDLKRVRELIGQPVSTPAVPGGSSQ